MARKTILISDLSGREISQNDGAKVTITFSDARRGQIVLDCLAEEITEMAEKGSRQQRRGRRASNGQAADAQAEAVSQVA